MATTFEQAQQQGEAARNRLLSRLMSQTDEQLAQTVKLFAAKQNWDDAYREHFDKNYLTFLQRIRDRKNYDQRPQLYTIMRTIQDTGQLTQLDVELLKQYDLKNWESIIITGRSLTETNQCYFGNVNHSTFSGEVFSSTFSGEVFSSTFSGEVFNSTFSGRVFSSTFSGRVFSSTFSGKVFSSTFSGEVFNSTFSQSAQVIWRSNNFRRSGMTFAQFENQNTFGVKDTTS